MRLRRGTEHPLLAWGLPWVTGTALVTLPGRYDAFAGVDTCAGRRIKTPGLAPAVAPSVVAAAAVAALLLDVDRWGATRGAVEGSEG
jgi:hypothetical protein